MMADNRGEMQGMGIHVIYQDDVIEVINVMPDSPALDAGIQAGDKIIAVDGETVASLGYTSAVSKLKGEAGDNREVHRRERRRNARFRYRARIYQRAVGDVSRL